ncbi:MAG: YigZ family protein [Caldisericia bacterium]
MRIGSRSFTEFNSTSTPKSSKTHRHSQKKHREMCHFCSAFRIRNQILTEKASDDGGTPAELPGKPILGALQRKNLMNCGIVVYRKFGGTKLGTAVLLKLMDKRLAIESAKIGQIIDMQGFSFSVDYSLWSKLEKRNKKL